MPTINPGDYAFGEAVLTPDRDLAPYVTYDHTNNLIDFTEDLASWAIGGSWYDMVI